MAGAARQLVEAFKLYMVVAADRQENGREIENALIWGSKPAIQLNRK